MGDGTIKRVLATRIMRGESSFGIQQDLDTGCRDKMSPEDAAPRYRAIRLSTLRPAHLARPELVNPLP